MIGSAFIGITAGWLAIRPLRGNGFGLIGDVIAGVFGAIVGGYVLGIAGADVGGLTGRLIVASIGAALVLSVVRGVTGCRAGRRVWS